MDEAARLLVVTFAPDDAHPSAALGPVLDDAIAKWDADDDELHIERMELPRVYGAWRTVADRLRDERPDWCLLLDLDPGSDEHKVHVFAANLDDSPLPDGEGVVRADTIIDVEGPVAFRTRLPQDGIWDKFIVERVPVRMSHRAGGHVFNHALYRLLQTVHDERLPVRVGAFETPPIGSMPDAAGAPRTRDQAAEEFRMLFAVLRQLRGAVPPTDGTGRKAGGA